MKVLLITLTLATTLLLAACNNAQTQPTPPEADTTPSRPTASQVLENNRDFTLSNAPDLEILEREWDLELDYATADTEAVFNFYDSSLTSQGFVQTSLERDGDEVEADYQRDNLRIDLEIERDDGDVQVDFDVTETAPIASEESFTLERFAGVNVPFFEAQITEIDWEFRIDYRTTDLEALFAFYNDALTSQRWERTSLEQNGDERDADYRKENVELELELELEDNVTQVEIEINKERFYQ
jgi:hypothetical protein